MLDAMTRPFGWRLPRLAIKVASYAFAGAALMLYINYPALQEFFQARERRDSYRDSVAALKKRYDQVLREQAELKDGGFEKEKTIRERLLMVKPGERILFIDPPSGGEGASARMPRGGAEPPESLVPRIAEILKQSIAPKPAPENKQVVAPPAAEAASEKKGAPPADQGKKPLPEVE